MVNIGILGSGFGYEHAKAFKKNKDLNVLGIFGRDEEKLTEIQQELGIPTFRDMGEIIENPDIDLVDICLPTELHKECAIECLKNHKHIVIESPVTYSSADAMAIWNYANEVKKEVFVDLVMRLAPEYIKIKEIIDAGKIGKIRSVFCNRRTPPIWKNIKKGKGVIFNFAIWEIDYLSWILGNPKDINVFSLNGYPEKDDALLIKLEYEKSAALIETNTKMPESFPFNFSIRIVGEKGAIDFVPYYINGKFSQTFALFSENGLVEVLNPEYKPEIEELADIVIGVLRNGKRNEVINIESAYQSILVAEEIFNKFTTVPALVH